MSSEIHTAKVDLKSQLLSRHLAYFWEGVLFSETIKTMNKTILPRNHKNYNFLDCDWFKKLLFFHLFTCQVVIGQFVIGHFVIGHFVIGQFNRPITFVVVV